MFVFYGKLIIKYILVYTDNEEEYYNWRPPRKRGLTPKTTKAGVRIRYVIIQSPQWFSALTFSSSEASNLYLLILYNIIHY